jgi:hypothetical protein
MTLHFDFEHPISYFSFKLCGTPSPDNWEGYDKISECRFVVPTETYPRSTQKRFRKMLVVSFLPCCLSTTQPETPLMANLMPSLLCQISSLPMVSLASAASAISMSWASSLWTLFSCWTPRSDLKPAICLATISSGVTLPLISPTSELHPRCCSLAGRLCFFDLLPPPSHAG